MIQQQVLIIAGIFLSSNLVAYIAYCIKNKGKSEKIEIMSVRSELKKIKKMDEADKKSMF
jgi:hypothetical protein